MKRESNGELLWKASLYLLQPGILVYWLALSFISVLVIYYRYLKPEDNFLLSFLLGIKGAGYIILYYKAIDSIVAILAKRETVGYKFNHTFTFHIAIRYALSLFLISITGIYLLPNSLGLLLSIFLFFISPAMLITIILKHKILEMFKPQNWQAAIEYVGKSRYFSILYMPMLVAIIAGIIFGIVFLIAVGGSDVPREKIEFSSLLLQSFLSPYFIILQMIYCAFIMRTPNINDHQLEQFEKKINKLTSNDFEMAKQAFAEGDYQKTVQILEPKVHIDNNHLPTYILLRQALLKIDDDKSKEFLKSVEFMMILQAGLDQDDFYLETKPQLTKMAEDHLDQLVPELLYPLILLAIKHEDYPLVLLLSRDFRGHFAEEGAIIEVGFYKAQSLDKTGKRQESIALLHDLLEEFPDHAEIGRIKRAYQILTESKA